MNELFISSEPLSDSILVQPPDPEHDDLESQNIDDITNVKDKGTNDITIAATCKIDKSSCAQKTVKDKRYGYSLISIHERQLLKGPQVTVADPGFGQGGAPALVRLILLM